MEWRPIETAPKDRTVVDLWAMGRRWPDMEWEVTCPSHPDGVWKRAGTDWYDAMGWLDPTHWMPLPPPPEETPR